MSNTAIFRSSFKEVARMSTSESNLVNLNDELPLNDAERNLEKLETMKVRKNALEETLEKKLSELRSICLREGEITGTLPKEFPLKENEEPPVIRRRMRTEFAFSDKLLMQPKTKDEEKLTKLELEFEIQCKIVKATSKLCNEMNTKKSIRKQRRQVYQQALAKLKDIEKNLQATKKVIEQNSVTSKVKQNNSMRLHSIEKKRVINDDQSEDEEILRNRHTFNISKDVNLLTMSSAPSTPIKCKLRSKKSMAINEHPRSDHNTFTNSLIENSITQRLTDNNSPEYDTISSAASSLESTNNALFPNYSKVNNYEELIENSSETKFDKLFGVNTRKSAIALNLSQDDCNLINKKQTDFLPFSIDKHNNDQFKSLTRHNSLDKMRQKETLKEKNVGENKVSSNVLSPNLINLQNNHFNFGLNKNVNNRSQNNINMAQRPLPSPPTEHSKKIIISNRPQQLNLNKEKSCPPPLNLNNLSDLHYPSKDHPNNSSLFKNPLKSPSTVSILTQSPLDFEKATNLYLQQPNDEISTSSSNLDISNLNNRDHQSIGNEIKMKPVRNSNIRKPIGLTINTCSNDVQSCISQKHSPVPILPPRTPVISKSNNLTNLLNQNSINNSISNLNLSSHQALKHSKNIILSNPNLNYTSNNPTYKYEKSTKTLPETCIDNFAMPASSINHTNNFGQNSNSNSQSVSLMNISNEQPILLNAIKYTQLRKNKLASSSQVPRHQSTSQPNYTINGNQFNSNQLINENNKSSLSSNSSSNNLHSFSQVFQPFLEEIKPYELSDFYKYSTKYKNSQKNIIKETNNEQKSPQSDSVAIKNSEVQSSQSIDKNHDKNDSDHLELIEDSFLVKNHVANEFSSELKDWLKEKYNNKTATLV